MLFIKIMATIAITSALFVLVFGLPCVFEWFGAVYVHSKNNSIKEKIFGFLDEASGWIAIINVFIFILSLITIGLYIIWC